MDYLVGALPVAAVLAAIAFGWLSAVGAGLLGTALTVAVACSVAPRPLSLAEAARAAGEGSWLVALVGLVILGGLFFRDAVAAGDHRGAGVHMHASQRARCFEACFLVGPFMEAVTGYGVGQMAAIVMLQKAGVAPLHVAVMALFSQTLVPWGAMANGTMVGSALADVSSVELGLRSAALTAPLLLGWLALFWLAARAAGVAAGMAERAGELCWVVAIAALLLLCNRLMGPEIAGVTALGPLIALRFCLQQRPSVADLRAAATAYAPYLALIAGLVASRSLPGFSPWLEAAAVLKPFAGAPSFHPLTNPGSWLILTGAVTILIFRPAAMARVALQACREGSRPLLTILLFLVMAKLMTASGMGATLGEAIRLMLGPVAPLATPVLAGLFGFITGSANASAGLLMQTQISLAQEAALNVGWIVAIQNTAAAALTMLSPVRVAMGCTFAGVPHLERGVYARAWPFGVLPIAVFTAIVAVMLVTR